MAFAEVLPDAAPVVLTEVAAGGGRRIGVAQLNSERTLNSLTLPMIERLYPQLERWAADDGIAAVLLCGAGDKAFCAGGDVKRICLAVRAHGIDDTTAADFFTAEYRLDYLIHVYRKPLLVWAGGIVMGGGIGLLAGASHRIVTPTSRLAMPEISIGLYPDVGGSWLLGRLGPVGLFLGMTAASINAADALATGLASQALATEARALLLPALVATDWSADASQHAAQVDAVLASLPSAPLPTGLLTEHAEEIAQRTARHHDLAALYADLTAVAAQPWLEQAAANLRAGSPTSAALILRQWRAGQQLSLAEVFRQELILSCQCARHPDFIEGVRALLVDKDRQPRWQPATLAQVSTDWLDAHYQAPWSGAHPLHDLGE